MRPVEDYPSIEFSNYLFYPQLFLNPPRDQEFGNVIPGFLQPIWRCSMFSLFFNNISLNASFMH